MKYIKYALLAASAFLMAQCSEEDGKTYPIQPQPQWNAVAEDFVTAAPQWNAADITPATAPGWKADFRGNAQSPQWTDPDKTVYPTSMTAVLRLSPILETLAADGDKMAAFIGDECRGVAQVVMNNGVRLFFIHVKAPSSEGGNVEFRYYSASANRVYTSVSADVKYEIDKIYGTADSPQLPDFEQSGPYPVATKAWVKVDTGRLPFTVSPGDELQAFVGDECRGIKHVESAADMLYWFDILGKATGETVYFRYYSAEKQQVFVSEQTTTVGARGTVEGSKSEPLLVSFVPQGSMTVYATLDTQLARYVDRNADQIAAFIGDVCAGKGEIVGEADGKPVYKIVVNGVSAQTKAIDIRYYSSRNNYVFTAPSCLTFAQGSVQSSQESPFTVPLVVSGKHPLKMTATVALPQDLARYATSSDMMAAFVGNECRGVAKVQTRDDGSFIFQMEINGSLSADEDVTLKYYSAKNSYLYHTAGSFKFVSGGSYGTPSEPMVPSLVIVE